MNHISIDQADETVKQFLRSLALHAEGAVLEIGGTPLLQVFPAHDDETMHRALVARGRELVRRARDRNRSASPPEIESAIDAAIEQVRQRSAV